MDIVDVVISYIVGLSVEMHHILKLQLSDNFSKRHDILKLTNSVESFNPRCIIPKLKSVRYFIVRAIDVLLQQDHCRTVLVF